MNIGVILDKAFPPDKRVENEATSLIQSGHTVFLYCFDYDHDQPQFETVSGIHVCRLKASKYLYKFSALAYSIPLYHQYLRHSIDDFIVDNKIEVLHIHDMQVARSVFQVNRKFNLPVVMDLHENRPEIMKFYPHLKSFLGKLLIHPTIWKKYEYHYIHEAQKVVVVTEEAKNYYVKEIGVDKNKFCIVPNTVKKDFYEHYAINEEIIEKYNDSYTILYWGDTGLRRGLVTTIKSLEYLIDKIPNIKLLILGKSRTDQLLKDLVVKLGYQNYVELAGWKNFDLSPSYILASNICISPLHKNIHHETTYANKIFQYMALGKPIIVSDCRAQQNIVEKYDCGLVFQDRNPGDFADKVLQIYKDEKLNQRFSDNGRKAVHNEMNWEKTIEELIKCYDDLSKSIL